MLIEMKNIAAGIRFVLILVLLNVSVQAIAAPAQKEQLPETGEAEKGEKKPPVSEKKRYEPSGRFTPSEKLRADDAVAFPVDI